MGNAIRWLKLEISKVDIDMSDAEAKQELCDAIDVFIRERVTFSDEVIVSVASFVLFPNKRLISSTL